MQKARFTTPKEQRQRLSINLLGAILAGGQARRFGSDKAYALYRGERLIDRVATALRLQCEAVIVCGRKETGFTCIADQPEPGLGPLGGLNAALLHAAQNRFTHVLSAGVDVPDLPRDLSRTLAGEGPAIVSSQPVIGLWPVSVAPALSQFVCEGGRALYGFAEIISARQIAFDPPLMNVNTPDDLDEQ